MRIKKDRSSKKKKLLTVAVVLIILALAAVFLYYRVIKEDVPIVNKSSDQQQASKLRKDPEKKETNSNSDKPASPTPTDSSNKKQVQMTASTDTASGMVFIRGGVNYPVTGGSCYAQLSGPSGQTIRKDTTILRNPASTDCKTISIPTSNLAPGKWMFTLHYISDDYEGVSDEISFSV